MESENLNHALLYHPKGSPSEHVLPMRRDGLYHKSRNLSETKLLVQMKSEFHNKEDLSKEPICSFFLLVAREFSYLP